MRKRSTLWMLFLIVFSFASITSEAQTVSDKRNTTNKEKGILMNSLSSKVKKQSNPARKIPLQNVSAGNIPTFYGTLLYTSPWGSNPNNKKYGVYSFNVTDNGFSSSPLILNDDFRDMYAGMYLDGKYYTLANRPETSTELPYVLYTTYNTSDWTIANQKKLPYTSIALDMTYDPIGKQFYVLSLDLNNNQVLATFDVATGDMAKIDIIKPMIALAANTDGKLYGIGTDSNFYSLDKSTGKETLIGPTDTRSLSNYHFVQSATFDYSTGRLYWVACFDDQSSSLYEIDLTSGKALLIQNLPTDDQITGLYILGDIPDATAPFAVSNLQFNFTTLGSTEGNISFKAPTTNFSGEALSGNMDITITQDEEIIKTLTDIAPGADYESEKITIPAGLHTINVTPSNENGKGPVSTIRIWSGPDVPAAVNNLKAIKAEDGGAILTWETPTKGAHDGLLNSNSITYKIIRNPDNYTVIENLTTNTYTDYVTSELGYFTYTVIPVSDGGEGIASTSETLMLGKAFDVPYTADFTKQEDCHLWTIIDNNKDGKTWFYNENRGHVSSDYNGILSNDDWFISPAIQLSSEKVYKLEYEAAAGLSSCPQNFKVTIGKSPNLDSQVTILDTHENFKDNVSKAYEVIFSIPDDGIYYISFQDYSTVNQFAVYLFSFKLTALTSSGAPGKIEDLTITPDKQGALSALISFTTPSLTYSGQTLTAINTVSIYRNGEQAHTIQNPNPGKQYSWTDEHAIAGNCSYRIFASNDKGDGMDVEQSAFIGLDTPKAIESVTLKKENNKAVISWEPVTEGINNGYLGDIHYQIERSDNVIVADNISITNYTDDVISSISSGQKLISYKVTPINANDIAGQPTTSNEIAFGFHYTVPFAESFAGSKQQNEPWIIENTSKNGIWSIQLQGYNPTARPQDNDGGLASFNGYMTNGGMSRLISPSITLKDSKTPTLQFYLYHNYDGENKGDDRVQIEVAVNGGDFTEIEGALFKRESQEFEGWRMYEVPLVTYQDAEFINLSFKGIGGYGQNLHIDNIRIVESYTYDLEMTDLSGPSTVEAGKSKEMIVTILNKGAEATNEYTVELYRDGSLFESKAGTSIAAGATSEFKFMLATTLDDANTSSIFTAKIIYSKDEVPENNDSKEWNVQITEPIYPKITELQGIADNNKITLSWTAPETGGISVAEAITDDFESYPTFAIDNIGQWLMYDGDKKTTYGISGVDYDHKNDPKAFQVINFDEFMYEDEDAEKAWAPHSGVQHLICFDAKESTNDDWLISPELSKNEQTVTFFAKTAVSKYGKERFEFWSSISGTEITDFTKLNEGDYIEAPDSWTKYSFTVPAGTKYFAIRCVSNDSYAFCVDDVTYEPLAGETNYEVSGYNIYRDGKKINSDLIKETTYTDNGLEDGTYSYKVTAVYPEGESYYSDAVEVTAKASGIESITTQYQVYAQSNSIIIKGIGNKNIAVCNVDGYVLYKQSNSDENIEIPVQQGIYIVTIEEEVYKVFVK